MNWEEFVEATNETAFYPDAGQKTPIEFAYVALGLAGELGELLTAKTIESRRKEAGDCFWYLARAFKMTEGFALERTYRSGSMVSHVALLLGNTTKKTLRDGGVTEKLLDKLRQQYADIYSWVYEAAIDLDPAGPPNVLTDTIEKLRSRKERGVLGGGGDNR